MGLRWDSRLCVFVFLWTALCAPPMVGQTSSPAAVSPADDSYEAFTLADDLTALNGPELPQRGFNASLAFSGLHDSQLGWAGFTQPAVSFRFNRVFSTDATIPIYFYVNGLKYNPKNINNEHLTTLYGELGDTTIAGHAQFSPGRLDYTATTAFNVPTGDKTYGLSTGRVTYELMNDFETQLKNLIPDLQLGFGDNSDLVNRKVQRNYDTLGKLAYFQAGGAYALPWSWELRGDGYEQLPIGNQKLYTSVIRRQKHVLIPTTSSAEDNGLTVFINSPAARHFQISSYYNRSVYLGDDTVGLTLTFQLKAAAISVLPEMQ